MTGTARPDALHEPADTDPRARGRSDFRAVGPVAAPASRWLRFGIAAALGLVAGTTLFATEAQGRDEGRREGSRGRLGGRR